jgi:hypothetical protein
MWRLRRLITTVMSGRFMFAQYKSLPTREENGKALTPRVESLRSVDDCFAAMGLRAK